MVPNCLPIKALCPQRAGHRSAQTSPPVTSSQILLIAIPLAVIEIALLLLAVFDLLRQDREVRGGSKAVWAVVIVFVNIIGPLVYFFAGRVRRPRQGRGAPRRALLSRDHQGPGRLAKASLRLTGRD